MSLSNETINLFLAPWNIEQNMDVFELYNCKDLCSFACTDEKNAHRFVHLPEMYDAMVEMLEIICGIPGEDACEHCQNASMGCRVREWRFLLRKVRDGE